MFHKVSSEFKSPDCDLGEESSRRNPSGASLFDHVDNINMETGNFKQVNQNVNNTNNMPMKWWYFNQVNKNYTLLSGIQGTILCALVALIAYTFLYPTPNQIQPQQPADLGPAAHSISLPDILHHRVSMNAVLNEKGRADDAKCHPGTRDRVLGDMERWMDTLNSSHGILWLNGPAGAGKTAIMKTITERSKARNVTTVNFFFFREDRTRNTPQSLVATLLYQIWKLFPGVRDGVTSALADNPLIFDATIQEQFDMLISPFIPVIQQSLPEASPIFLLIDGLDECDHDDKRFQLQVLHALDTLIAQEGSPFRALVGSRDEPHIRAEFGRLGAKVSAMVLNEDYSPEEDIRLFVTAQFDSIKKTHPSAQQLDHDWPAKTAINEIVGKSSGQFIYAATVMRFISDIRAVPSLSLERIQGIVPTGKNSPFAHIDSIYRAILEQVDDPDATQDILASTLLDNSNRRWVNRCDCPEEKTVDTDAYEEHHSRCHHMSVQHDVPSTKQLLRLYNPRYTNIVVDSALLDLTALVRLQADRVVFYHASLTDFLEDSSRSNEFYINLGEFSEKVFPALWRLAIYENTVPVALPLSLLRDISLPTAAVTEALLAVYPSAQFPVNRDSMSTLQLMNFMAAVSRLYYQHDVKSYKQIIQMWATWAIFSNMTVYFPRHFYYKWPLILLRVWSGWDIHLYRSHGYIDEIPLFERYLVIAGIKRWLGVGPPEKPSETAAH